MAGKRRQGTVISLEQRREQRRQDSLAEANRKMLAAEHALFVALRLAGHRGPSSPTAAGKSSPENVVVLPLRPRPKRAA